MTRRIAAASVVVIAALAVAIASGALSRPASGPGPGRTVAVGGTSALGGASALDSPSLGTIGGAPSAVAGASGSTSGSPGAASATPGGRLAGGAPTSARGFRLRATVVPIGYPLPASASYRYGQGWHAFRLGAPLPYESVLGISPTGALLRAHDGVDIQVRIGTPVLAAFSGVVIDPRTNWYPWAPQLYGNVVVIRSTEPTSIGYVAINAHLSVVSVRIGAVVRRGEVVGRTGISGNARGTIPHLHFELRAPFKIDQTWGGVFRRIDSFDPLPSLLAADPHRHP
ncbi:MAG: M23 family metallopeptidase [Candidatus Limnocylindrales bacterium]